MIYLASPYAHKNPLIMELRFEKVCRVAGAMMKDGLFIYSPIAHNHPIATRIDLPRTWDFWKNIDLHILEKCDQLWVLKLEGWEESKGVAAEIKFAEEKKIPITYVPEP